MTDATKEKIETVKTEINNGATLQKALKTAKLSAATWYNSQRTSTKTKRTHSASRTQNTTDKPVFLVRNDGNATYLFPIGEDSDALFRQLSHMN